MPTLQPWSEWARLAVDKTEVRNVLAMPTSTLSLFVEVPSDAAGRRRRDNTSVVTRKTTSVEVPRSSAKEAGRAGVCGAGAFRTIEMGVLLWGTPANSTLF